LITTVGKLIFNEILPTTFPYLNEPTMTNLQEATPDKYFLEKGTDVVAELKNRPIIDPFKKGFLGNVIAEVFKRFETTETSRMLDRMKNLGFKHSTRAGITVGIADIIVLPDKQEILVEAQDNVDRVMKSYRRGLITEDERYERVVKSWNDAKDEIQSRLMKSLNRLNPIRRPIRFSRW